MFRLQKCKQGFPDHLEFAFEVRGEYALADTIIYVLELPPAPFIDLVVVRVKLVCAYNSKDIDQFLFDR